GDQYSAYIYDVKLGRELKLPVNLPYHEQKALPIPSLSFSPDSSKIAWEEDQFLVGIKDFVIFDLINHSSIIVPYPAKEKSLNDYRLTHLIWSLDGKEIYLHTIASEDTYYKYDVASKKISKINAHEFGDLSVFKPPHLQERGIGQGRVMK